MVVNHRRLPFIARGLQRLLRNGWYRAQVPDPELRRKLTPSYGFGCKRPAVSNTYLRTFMRDNVELVTAPIERVTPTGVVDAEGREREVDALILATGFRLASDPEVYTAHADPRTRRLRRWRRRTSGTGSPRTRASAFRSCPTTS